MKILLLLLVFTSVSGYGQFSGGSGVAQDPYLISSKEDIYALIDSIRTQVYNPRYKYSDKHYRVTKNIRDSVRKPIPNFSGVFDGQGYKITLAINNTGYNGLFARTYGAKIYNVVVDGFIKKDSTIQGHMNWTGGIVGYAQNTEIYNCANFINITSEFTCVGGIVGHLEFSRGKLLIV